MVSVTHIEQLIRKSARGETTLAVIETTLAVILCKSLGWPVWEADDEARILRSRKRQFKWQKLQSLRVHCWDRCSLTSPWITSTVGSSAPLAVCGWHQAAWCLPEGWDAIQRGLCRLSSGPRFSKFFRVAFLYYLSSYCSISMWSSLHSSWRWSLLCSIHAYIKYPMETNCIDPSQMIWFLWCFP